MVRPPQVAARMLALALAVTAFAARPLPGQGADPASLAGTVADSAGKPLGFTTVWLVPADTALLSQGALTDAAGAFAFERLPPGRYYLRVDRVGYRSEWSDARTLASGQRLRLAVTSAGTPIVLGPITAAGRCRTGEGIAQDTVLATLWTEARKAAVARRLFDGSYRYQVRLVEELRIWYGAYHRDRTARHTLASTPAAARKLAETGATAGYGVAMDSSRLVAVPEMLQVLTERFGRAHCLYVLPDRRGRRRIHFQPLTDAVGVSDVAGNILLDREYRLRRIEFEYRMGARSSSRGYVGFHEAGPGGRTIGFLNRLVAWVYDAPASRGERIVSGLGWSVPDGKERAQVWANYGHFQRDTAAP